MTDLNVEENYEIQKKEIHEFKNHLNCILELLGSEKPLEALKYVTDLIGEMKEKVDFIDTNHTIINAVINAKYREAYAKDILLVLKINDLSEINIPDTDIVTILTNLLDNAIESCEKCEGKKIIRLKSVVESNEYWIISVNNPIPSSYQFDENKIVSTKPEKEKHGYGVANVKEIIRKNCGDCVIKCERGQFIFTIMLPLGIPHC